MCVIKISDEPALKAVVQLWCLVPCRVQPNALASPFPSCQTVLTWAWGQCIAMHAGCVYICKLHSVRNVPRRWNPTICTLKLLKQSHLQFQPVPASAVLDTYLEVSTGQGPHPAGSLHPAILFWKEGRFNSMDPGCSVPKNGHSHARFTRVAVATLFCPFLMDGEAS